jgi:tripartite-type tricarboxylate transporter receptor subunit TctC
VFAPSGLAPDKVEKLSAALAAGVRQPQTRERLLALGLQPTGTTAAELARIQNADSQLWAPAVKASGFTPAQ